MGDSDLLNAWSRPLRTGIVDIPRTVADGTPSGRADGATTHRELR
jgi:hypothetical protein